jgi:hypothetical protein
LNDFAELLQRGFKLKARAQSSIREALCGQFGVLDEYLDHRINTIFLDGKPVDNVDSAKIGTGSVLALSAAMPGFVGAAFRKGGYYARMRHAITHTEGKEMGSGAEGFFVVKLYNMVADELGPLFLASGVWLDLRELVDFLSRRSAEFWSRCRGCRANGRQIDPGNLPTLKWLGNGEMVHLTVETGEDGKP